MKHHGTDTCVMREDHVGKPADHGLMCAECRAEQAEHATSDEAGVFILKALEMIYPKPESDYSPRRTPMFSPDFDAWAKVDAKVRNHVQFGAFFDAAMLLIPEEMRDEIEITTLYQVARVTINMNHGDDGCPFYGSNLCNSIPLAITCAALRARAGGL